MGMATGPQSRSGVSPAMNVTPLVDVVLVLLIIFMVVTPLMQKQFWLTLPKKDDPTERALPSPQSDAPVVLSVDAAGVILVNKSPVPKAELRERLSRIFAARSDNVLYFDAADDAPYGVAADAMDIARMGGAKTIAILTKRPGS